MRAIAAICLLCSLTGCLVVALPQADISPRIDICDAGEVYAFRKEITHTRGSGMFLGRSNSADAKLETVPSEHGVIAPQMNAAIRYWLFIFPIEGGQSHDLKVVLYRPGYESVVVDSWPWWLPIGYLTTHRHIEWKQTADLASQKKALDILTANVDLKDVQNAAAARFIQQERTRIGISVDAPFSLKHFADSLPAR